VFRYNDRVSLLVQQLKAAIADLAKTKGIAGARVLDKVNRYGEVVIALILPSEPRKEETQEK
jgi:hypothetical protein